MIKQFFAAATIVTALASIQTEASFVHTDWKTEGDKKAVLHTETGLEWLNLQETAGKNANTVISQLDTLYVGWRLPTYHEVLTMFTAFMANNKSNPYIVSETNYTAVRNFISLFSASTPYQYNFGIFQSLSNDYKFIGVYESSNTIYGFGHPVHYSSSRSGYLTPMDTGVWLVSDGGTTLSSMSDPSLNINNPNAPINQSGTAADVASPAGLAAAGALLMILGARRRKLLSK